MGVIAKGILRGRQGLFTPVSLGYPLSVFNKNSTLKDLLALAAFSRMCVRVRVCVIVFLCVCTIAVFSQTKDRVFMHLSVFDFEPDYDLCQRVYTCIYIYKYLDSTSLTYIYVCIQMYTYIYVYVYIYVYIHNLFKHEFAEK